MTTVVSFCAEYLSFQKISKDEAFKEITKELNENTETGM